jgi:hypothetical protein
MMKSTQFVPRSPLMKWVERRISRLGGRHAPFGKLTAIFTLNAPKSPNGQGKLSGGRAARPIYKGDHLIDALLGVSIGRERIAAVEANVVSFRQACAEALRPFFWRHSGQEAFNPLAAKNIALCSNPVRIRIAGFGLLKRPKVAFWYGT